MKIGIVYDLKEDYGIDRFDINFEDFSTLSEMQNIRNELEILGYNATLIGSPVRFAELITSNMYSQYDLIMNFSEGFASRNREALVPAVCELFDIPYTFSDNHAMTLTLDKHQTLLFAESLGIKTPRGFLFNPDVDNIDDVPFMLESYNISFPIVCKPNYEGTSMGITLTHSCKELKKALIYLISLYNEPIRCDEYISGREIAVPIIGSGNDARIMGIVEYQKLDGSVMDFYTYKYKRHGHHKTILADYGKDINSHIEKTALSIHRNIPCYDLSRIDLRLKEGIPYLMEVTPVPDLTRKATFEKCANKMGLTYGDILNTVIESAINRFNK